MSWVLSKIGLSKFDMLSVEQLYRNHSKQADIHVQLRSLTYSVSIDVFSRGVFASDSNRTFSYATLPNDASNIEVLFLSNAQAYVLASIVVLSEK